MTTTTLAVIWIPIVTFIGFMLDIVRRCRKRARSYRTRHVIMNDSDYVSPFDSLLWTYELQIVREACSRCIVCGRHYDLPLLTLSHELDVHGSPPWWRRVVLFDEPTNLKELVTYCQESI